MMPPPNRAMQEGRRHRRRPSLAALAWAAAYAGIPMFQVGVAATFLARGGERVRPAAAPAARPLASVEAPKPVAPEAGPEGDAAPPPEGPSFTLIDREPEDPLRDVVAMDAARERSLLNLNLFLARNAAALGDAASAHRAVVTRIEHAFAARIEEDIRRGGPLADRTFRQRWDRVVHGRLLPRHEIPRADGTLEADVVKSMPVTRTRLVALAEAARGQRDAAERSLADEQSILSFLRSVPAGGDIPDLLLPAPSATGHDVTPHLNNAAVLREVFGSPINSTVIGRALPPGPGGLAQYFPVEVDDVCLRLLPQGLVRSAYMAHELDLDLCLKDLPRAEVLLREFLVGDGFGGPETWKRPALWVEAPRPEEAAGKQEPVALTEHRLWTDTRGRTFFGRLMAVEGEAAVLESPAGKTLRCPVVEFAAKDRAFLEPFLKGQKPPQDAGARRIPAQPRRRQDPNWSQKEASEVLPFLTRPRR